MFSGQSALPTAWPPSATLSPYIPMPNAQKPPWENSRTILPMRFQNIIEQVFPTNPVSFNHSSFKNSRPQAVNIISRFRWISVIFLPLITVKYIVLPGVNCDITSFQKPWNKEIYSNSCVIFEMHFKYKHNNT